jgi:hypothetical protein
VIGWHVVIADIALREPKKLDKQSTSLTWVMLRNVQSAAKTPGLHVVSTHHVDELVNKRQRLTEYQAGSPIADRPRRKRPD